MKTIFSLGLMTGTSCDGADLALSSFTLDANQVHENLLYTSSKSFPTALRSKLRTGQRGLLSLQELGELNVHYSKWLASVCVDFLKKHRHSQKWLTLLCVHGQTLWHDVERRFSFQLLEPAILAFATGLSVFSSFRQSDMARGGEGAPLVPLYNWLHAHGIGWEKRIPFSIHNIGGIANLTIITPKLKDLCAFDTGPGNALMDLATEKFTQETQAYDRNGKIAQTALNSINQEKLEQLLLTQPYFSAKPPKSTGRELFNESFLKYIPGKGAAMVANATAFTALSIVDAYQRFILKKYPLKEIFFSGGGASNPTLLHLIKKYGSEKWKRDIPCTPLPASFAPPAYLEAMAFGRLGLEAFLGNPVSITSVTGARENGLGISLFTGKNYLKLVQFLADHKKRH